MKRILSLVLAAVMVFALLPLAVASDAHADVQKFVKNDNADAISVYAAADGVTAIGTIAPAGVAKYIEKSGDYIHIDNPNGYVKASQVTEMTPKLTAEGGIFVLDGKAHAVKAELQDGRGFTIEYSINDGSSWTTAAPSISAAGKLTVKVRATNKDYVISHPDVVLQILADIPQNATITLIPHGTTTKIPVRKTASTHGSKVGTLTAGTTCRYLERSEEWYKIKTDKLEGYVYYWFIGDVDFSPYFTLDPKNVTGLEGSSLQMSVTAAENNGGALSYQWYFMEKNGVDWKPVASNGNAATYSFTIAASMDGYKYRCQISNFAGTAVSKAATVTLIHGVPGVSTQPMSISAVSGKEAQFSVVGTEAETYQWQYRDDKSDWKDATAASADLATYKFVASSSQNGLLYRCVLRNAAGSTVSDEATLTVIAGKPKITKNIAKQTVTIDKTYSFTVAADGTDVNYQWQQKAPGGKWTDIAGETSDTLSGTAAIAMNKYQLRCRVYNLAGSVNTKAAQLKVVYPYTFKITKQPVCKTPNAGDSRTLTVTTNGTDVTYQWQSKVGKGAWTDISGEESASLDLVDITPAMSGTSYRCVVRDKYARTLNSKVIKLKVKTAKPVITVQPSNVEAKDGDSVSFHVTASGYMPTYQWQMKTAKGKWQNLTLSSATTDTLTINATLADNGCSLRCIVKNAGGSATSKAAVITVK